MMKKSVDTQQDAWYKNVRSIQNIYWTLFLRKEQGYTDGRVKCRRPVEEPGTVPRVRTGNFVALLIERKGSCFMSWL